MLKSIKKLFNNKYKNDFVYYNLGPINKPEDLSNIVLGYVIDDKLIEIEGIKNPNVIKHIKDVSGPDKGEDIVVNTDNVIYKVHKFEKDRVIYKAKANLKQFVENIDLFKENQIIVDKKFLENKKQGEERDFFNSQRYIYFKEEERLKPILEVSRSDNYICYLIDNSIEFYKTNDLYNKSLYSYPALISLNSLFIKLNNVDFEYIDLYIHHIDRLYFVIDSVSFFNTLVYILDNFYDYYFKENIDLKDYYKIDYLTQLLYYSEEKMCEKEEDIKERKRKILKMDNITERILEEKGIDLRVSNKIFNSLVKVIDRGLLDYPIKSITHRLVDDPLLLPKDFYLDYFTLFKYKIEKYPDKAELGHSKKLHTLMVLAEVLKSLETDEEKERYNYKEVFVIFESIYFDFLKYRYNSEKAKKKENILFVKLAIQDLDYFINLTRSKLNIETVKKENQIISMYDDFVIVDGVVKYKIDPEGLEFIKTSFSKKVDENPQQFYSVVLEGDKKLYSSIEQALFFKSYNIFPKYEEVFKTLNNNKDLLSGSNLLEVALFEDKYTPKIKTILNDDSIRLEDLINLYYEEDYKKYVLNHDLYPIIKEEIELINKYS